ncbi:MAG TPA: transcriptional regulator [Thermoanaerobaculia bacterium]|jgi:DNA-binding winged helix-turn-helix (wHTH) protein/tetratricopeptide (TPR) repeat protein
MCEERLRFGELELRPGSGELFRAGEPVKLQPQPARVLEILARHPGEVVSREDLRRHLWGEETFVDFEHGLNFSIRQLRRALGDSADCPHFVETVPRHGYRFLQPVTVEAAAPPAPGPPAPAVLGPSMRTRWRVAPGLVAALALLLVLGLALPPHVSKGAWEAYLEGRHFSRREATAEEMEKAVAAFQRATLLAPHFAPAYTGLAAAEMRLRRRLEDKLPVAEAAARRAIILDSHQAKAHLILAWIALYRLDVPRVQEETEQALAASPNLAAAYPLRAKYLAILGRHGEAVAAAERARGLDPEGQAMAPDLLCYHLLLAHRYDETIACGQHIAETLPADSPDASWASVWALWAARLAGDPDRALTIAGEAAHPGADPAPPRFKTLSEVWRWDLGRLGTLTPDLFSADRAADVLALGDRDHALDLLEQATDHHDWDVPLLAVDPRFDALQGDPRFERLLRRLRLPRVTPPSPHTPAQVPLLRASILW